MIEIDKKAQKIHNTDQPTPFLSDNTTEFVTANLEAFDYNILVEFGSGNSTRYFLKKLLALARKCLFISVEPNYYWFKEAIKSIQSDIEGNSISEKKSELKPWSYEKCKRYLYGTNNTSLNVPSDLKRLSKAKKKFAGRLNMKMLLYRFNPGSRPQDGCFSITIDDSVTLLLILSSEFMKDQFGESPIKKEYLTAALGPIIQKLSAAETVMAAFFVDGGPRGDIINSILDIEDRYDNFRPTIFLCDARRSYYDDAIRRRPSGIFLRGSNRTLSGEPVYQKTTTGRKAQFVFGKNKVLPKELAERELWFYQAD